MTEGWQGDVPAEASRTRHDHLLRAATAVGVAGERAGALPPSTPSARQSRDCRLV